VSAFCPESCPDADACVVGKPCTLYALAAELSGAAPQYVHLAVPNHMAQAQRLLASKWLADYVEAQKTGGAGVT
jgi:hypothetical protein